jgi:hypothetical protein
VKEASLSSRRKSFGTAFTFLSSPTSYRVEFEKIHFVLKTSDASAEAPSLEHKLGAPEELIRVKCAQELSP